MSARFALVIATALAAAGCGGGKDATSNEAVEDVALPPDSEASGATPMRERVAVLGLLNKRNGIVRDLTLKPGQSIRVKDVIVRLRACETTAPWETEKLTGAFVQVDVERPDKRWARVFSGWLYKESPSLNVVEHAVYDVWPRSCTMRWPGAPDPPPAPSAPSRASRAPKSGGSSTAGSTPPNSAQPPAEEPAAPEPSAAPSNAT